MGWMEDEDDEWAREVQKHYDDLLKCDAGHCIETLRNKVANKDKYHPPYEQACVKRLAELTNQETPMVKGKPLPKDSGIQKCYDWLMLNHPNEPIERLQEIVNANKLCPNTSKPVRNELRNSKPPNRL